MTWVSLLILFRLNCNLKLIPFCSCTGLYSFWGLLSICINVFPVWEREFALVRLHSYWESLINIYFRFKVSTNVANVMLYLFNVQDVRVCVLKLKGRACSQIASSWIEIFPWRALLHCTLMIIKAKRCRLDFIQHLDWGDTCCLACESALYFICTAAYSGPAWKGAKGITGHDFLGHENRCSVNIVSLNVTFLISSYPCVYIRCFIFLWNSNVFLFFWNTFARWKLLVFHQ